MNKKGFTLTEVIIVLVILGALALILVPAMMKMMPDDHNIKYKKAFYTIQEIISDIINDPSVCQGMNAQVVDGEISYSNMTAGNEDNILTTCAIINNTAHTVTSRDLGDEIRERLNITAGSRNGLLITTNGMVWNLPTKSLRDINNSNWDTDAVIYVDVDGGGFVSPNARDESKGWYRINIDASGQVTAPDSWNEGEDANHKTELQLLIGND